jgi:hypothetical protein
VSVLPNTTTKGADRRWPLYVLVAAALLALALGVEAFLRAETFLPREDISTPGIRDIVVSPENSLYPPPDTAHFEEPPEAIFVYLSVEELPGVEGMEARVERAQSGSAFSLLLDRGAGIEVLDEQEDQLSTGENGATGIMKFALKTSSGEPVPPGNYTVEVYGPGVTGEEEGAVAVRKLFVIEE